MTTTTSEVEQRARAAKLAARRLSTLSTEIKNDALNRLAASLVSSTPQILEANAADVERGRADELSAAVIDRLRLPDESIDAIAKDVRTVASQPDHVGEEIEIG